ncbi:hypothetical protein ACXO20_06630 [Lactobacillus delbrueckii subsp. bulgaricus]
MANHVFVQNNAAMLAVPVEERENFWHKLVKFYETGQQDDLNDFLLQDLDWNYAGRFDHGKDPGDRGKKKKMVGAGVKRKINKGWADFMLVLAFFRSCCSQKTSFLLYNGI